MRIGFCNGCFDRFHAGHQYFLEEARKHCGYLIVAINSDASVKLLKGSGRPIQRWAKRAAEVMETGLVDAVIPFEGDSLPLIGQIHPDVVIRGHDQEETKGAVRVGHLQGFSTSLTLAETRRPDAS